MVKPRIELAPRAKNTRGAEAIEVGEPGWFSTTGRARKTLTWRRFALPAT
jgi:hypothetical protein